MLVFKQFFYRSISLSQENFTKFSSRFKIGDDIKLLIIVLHVDVVFVFFFFLLLFLFLSNILSLYKNHVITGNST